MIDLCLSCIVFLIAGTSVGYYFIGPADLVIATLIMGYMLYKRGVKEK